MLSRPERPCLRCLRCLLSRPEGPCLRCLRCLRWPYEGNGNDTQKESSLEGSMPSKSIKCVWLSGHYKYLQMDTNEKDQSNAQALNGVSNKVFWFWLICWYLLTTLDQQKYGRRVTFPYSNHQELATHFWGETHWWQPHQSPRFFAPPTLRFFWASLQLGLWSQAPSLQDVATEFCSCPTPWNHHQTVYICHRYVCGMYII